MYYFVFYPEKIYSTIKSEKLWVSLVITWLIIFMSLFYIFLLSGILELFLRMTTIIYQRYPMMVLFSSVFYGSFTYSVMASLACFAGAFLWNFFFSDFKRSSYELIAKSFLYSSLIPIIIFVGYRLIQIIIPLVLSYSYTYTNNSNAIFNASIMIFHWGGFFDYIVYALVIVNFFYFFVKSMSYFIKEKESKILIKSITPISIVVAILLILVYFVLPLFPAATH